MTQIKTGCDLAPAAHIDGQTVVIQLRGEIDLHNSPDLRGVLLELIAHHQPTRLVLNLTQVPYMDSSALAVLVEGLQAMRKAKGRIYLTNLQPRVRGLIEIARLDTIFVLCQDEAEALAR